MVARDWDAYWLERARLNATMTTCSRRAVGAVATRDRRSFADAFNGNLPGAQHCDDGGCDRCAQPSATGMDLHRCRCVHAEQNIVGFCARNGIGLERATLYQTTKPCLDCVKLLVVSGVVEIVYADDYPSYDVGLDEYLQHFITLRRFDGRS